MDEKQTKTVKNSWATIDYNKLIVGDRRTGPKLVLESQKHIRINILLMTLIAIVLFGTQMTQKPLTAQESLLRDKILLSKKNLQEIEKICPSILEDKKLCEQKLSQCRLTLKQFSEATEQLISNVNECESTIKQNIDQRHKMNQEILNIQQKIAVYSEGIVPFVK